MPNLIISEFIERNDIKNYAKQVIKNTVLEIAKVDHVFDYASELEKSPQKSLGSHHKESSKSQDESPFKHHVSHLSS